MSLSMCLNKKVLIGLGAVAVGLFLFRPGWAVAALPVLILAVCPLSMIFMMRGMKGQGANGASPGSGAKPQAAGTASASEIDRSQQIADLQSELRRLKAINARQDSDPYPPAADRADKNVADPRP
ncbi:hypothetical protein JOF29_000072 [Kribbella aluminosa]|uniref:DUF2933 domain-containing protein n=1 Tax=Kribbella aluminosa TaxID=416017 RepID=A0ABS4UBG0_9ACTN|nr:DUF2933 domain-containing protein [Kribbella aluminosa]MBP2348989.1 hypothetical protein [Kribbella aluminosa]